MNIKVFCVYDAKVEAFLNPFYNRTQGEAIRNFTNLANDKDSQVSLHPADYFLYQLGEYNQATGQFENLAQPKSLGPAIEYVKSGS